MGYSMPDVNMAMGMYPSINPYLMNYGAYG